MVLVTETACRDLEALVRSHSRPASTRQRVRASTEPLRDFPELGARLHGRWADLRFVLGPWRWMIVVYRHDPGIDRPGFRSYSPPNAPERGSLSTRRASG